MSGFFADRITSAAAATRDASGTGWQPDAGEHGGIHTVRGDWMVMTHAMLNLVYDSQSGPRGGDKTFVAGMLMTSARRDFDDGSKLNLRAMLSPAAVRARLRALAADWTPPRMPVGGRDLARLGLTPGPETGRVLKAFEDGWVADDFPAEGHERRLKILIAT